MSLPSAYFLTWTCYGTWLPGDERGSIDRNHNIPGTPTLEPDIELAQRSRNAMTHECELLTPDARRIVERAISDHCQIRHWELLALTARSNHVHVVVFANDESPEQVLTQSKSWSTRRLREAGLVASDQRVWTRHGSTRWLNDEQSVAAAVRYVTEAQDQPRNQ